MMGSTADCERKGAVMDGHIGGFGGWHAEITPACTPACFVEEPFDPRPWGEQQEQVDWLERGEDR